MERKRYLIIGGDNRNIYLARSLQKKGKEVAVYGIKRSCFVEEEDNVLFAADPEEGIRKAEILIGPIPFSKDGETLYTPLTEERIRIEDLLRYQNSRQILLAGPFPPWAEKMWKEKGLTMIDLMKRDDLGFFNAVPTAEGAVKIAIEETDDTLFDSHIALWGFGKVGKILASRLKAFGAHVTVIARREEALAEAKAMGYRAVSLSLILTENENPQNEAILDQYDLIFNTIPFPVINRKILANCKRNVVIIDLASKPGGAGFILDKKRLERSENPAF